MTVISGQGDGEGKKQQGRAVQGTSGQVWPSGKALRW